MTPASLSVPTDNIGTRQTTKPRVGFVGVGWIGRHRMATIAESDAVEVAAIYDQSAETATEAARSLDRTTRVVASYDALLDSDLDGVVIATPNSLHADAAVSAIERGFAVFCQKPLARTAAETQRVVNAARAANVLLGVDLSYRFTKGMRHIHELVASGDLGEIYAVDAVFHNAYGPDKTWFYDFTLSGGGCVIDLGIHLVDLALWTLDFPRVVDVSSRLFCRGKPLVRGTPEVEDYAIARADLENGTSIQLACSWKLSAGWDAVIGATFYGTKGGAVLRNVNGSFYDFVVEELRGTQRTLLAEPPDDWGGRAAVDWARRLASGTRFDESSTHLVDVAEALDRIYGR